MEKRFQSQKNKFLFGSTSAIITNLALVVGLEASINAKLNIVASILVIAIADNISDTLGIHIYRRSRRPKRKRGLVIFIYKFYNKIFSFHDIHFVSRSIAITPSGIFINNLWFNDFSNYQLYNSSA